jgi:hypothetical protein
MLGRHNPLAQALSPLRTSAPDPLRTFVMGSFRKVQLGSLASLKPFSNLKTLSIMAWMARSASGLIGRCVIDRISARVGGDENSSSWLAIAYCNAAVWV